MTHTDSDESESHLPIPSPWTLETLPTYIDHLCLFINKYKDIGEFYSGYKFTHGYLVNWGEGFSLDEWLQAVKGEYKGQLPGEFAEFVRLCRELPLVENRSRSFPTQCHRNPEIGQTFVESADITSANRVSKLSLPF
jgi:hypothetical protein